MTLATTPATTHATTPAYDDLVRLNRRLHNLGHLGSIAGWDQAANMPPKGNEARAAALAELHGLMHRMRTDASLRDRISSEITPLAPGRLSTTTCWPKASASFGCRMRATRSVAPPGGKPTIIRTGREGNDWARAAGTAPASAAVAQAAVQAAERDIRGRIGTQDEGWAFVEGFMDASPRSGKDFPEDSPKGLLSQARQGRRRCLLSPAG